MNGHNIGRYVVVRGLISDAFALARGLGYECCAWQSSTPLTYADLDLKIEFSCRYWTAKGPQQALYVPAVFLHEGSNEIVVLELEAKRPGATEFLSQPDFSGATLD